MVSKIDIQNARKQLGLDKKDAVLGTGLPPYQPRTSDGLYWIREREASGFRDPIKLPLAAGMSMKVADGVPCQIGYDDSRNQVIYPAGGNALKTAGINPLVTNPLDPIIQKPIVSTDFPPFLSKRHGDTVAEPFTVVVIVPPVVLDTEVIQPNAQANIDISGEVPSTGLHCFTSIFWKRDNTLVARSSTPTNILDPLTIADLSETIRDAPKGSVPVSAWTLTGDDTALSAEPQKMLDLRQFVNLPPAGGEVTTTDATATVIGTVSVAESKVYTVSGRIAGAKDDYTAACGGTFSATVRRAPAGNVTLVGSAVVSVQEDSGGSPTFTVTVNTTDQTIEIKVTGIVAESWLWKAEWSVT